jgi:hypothetical protein
VGIGSSYKVVSDKIRAGQWTGRDGKESHVWDLGSFFVLWITNIQTIKKLKTNYIRWLKWSSFSVFVYLQLRGTPKVTYPSFA